MAALGHKETLAVISPERGGARYATKLFNAAEAR